MNKNRLWLIVVAAAGLLLAGPAVIGNVPFVNDDKAQASSGEFEDREGLIELLTVDTVSYDCAEELGEVNEWVVAALAGTPPRLFSDAIGLPAVGLPDGFLEKMMAAPDPRVVVRELQVTEEPKVILERTQLAICEDPELGYTWGNFFAHQSVSDVNLVDVNPWLQPSAVGADQINDQAAAVMTLLDVTDPTDEQLDQAVAKQGEYRQFADRVNSLFERYMLGGVEERASVLNYHLAGGAIVVGGLPEVKINDQQEDLAAVVLSVTEKGACVPVKEIGINVFDMRPEEFAPKPCEDKPTTTTAPPPPPETTGPPPPETVPPTTCDCPPPTTGPTTTQPAPTTTQPGPTTTEPSPTTTQPSPTTTQPAPTTTQPGPTTTVEFKDDEESPVSDDENDEEEETRPIVTAPEVVIRPDNPTSTTQPAPQPTIPDQPEVTAPEPATDGPAPTTPAPPDPVDVDHGEDGVPD